jgi:integrase
MLEAKIPKKVGDFSEASETAQTLVRLLGSRTKESSQGAYASAINRYLVFAQRVLNLEPAEALPSRPQETIPESWIELFVAWAGSRYKVSTIKVTLSALIEWHKSKCITPCTVSNPSINQLLGSIAAEQGPEGLPKGKTGMSKSLLRVLLALLREKATSNPRLAQIYQRDAAWLVLGYYGLLRRSELIALKMSDISFRRSHFEVFIRKSKNDKVGEGVGVCVVNVTKDGVSLVDRVEVAYHARLAQGAKPEDPFLTRWDMDLWTPSDAPLKNGQALAERLKTYLTEVNARYPSLATNPNSYGMHSLRRGGTVAAWAAGMDKARLMAHGRWRSNAIKAYLTASLAIKLSVTQSM